jgi:hypothetical protein
MSDVDEAARRMQRHREAKTNGESPYWLPRAGEFSHGFMRSDADLLAFAFLDSRAAVAGLVAAAKRLDEDYLAHDDPAKHGFMRLAVEQMFAEFRAALAAVGEG